MIFQDRGRPQGNIPKKGNRDFLRSPEPGRVIKTGPGNILNRAGQGRAGFYKNRAR